MMALFRAIGRFIRSIFYFFAGKTDKAAEGVEANAYAMGAKYDDVLRSKRERITQYLDATALVIQTIETKKETLKAKIAEEQKAETRRAGAAKVLKKRTDELLAQGKTPDECKIDPEFMRHREAFGNFKARETELETEIATLEQDIKDGDAKVKEHERNVNKMRREIEKLMQEKGEAIAEVITNKEEERANKLFAGISDDRTGKDLEELRNVRTKSRAQVKASELAAGTGMRRDEDAYDAAAAAAEVDKDLDADLFGDYKAPEPAPTEKVPPTNGAATKTAPESLPE